MSGHHFVSNDPEGGDVRCFRCDQRPSGADEVCGTFDEFRLTQTQLEAMAGIRFKGAPLTRQARDDLELRLGEPR